MTEVADAQKGNWVDNRAPEGLRPYLRLARVDRPIGFWLLFWPCCWSYALAGGTGSVSADVWFIALFAVGAFVMRSAGCAYNDILDRKFDAQVERTRSRPIPSGLISVKQAVLFTVGCCLIGLVVLLQFNVFTILLGFGSLLVVAVYPLMKRITYWPQFVLGLAFSWGGLMGWPAVHGSLSWGAVLVYAAAVVWTIGYDTIYAHQDKEDDALLGLKSTALRFGKTTPAWLTVFYSMMIVLLGAAGVMIGMGVLFYVGLALAAGHLGWQVYTLDIDDGDNCLRRFRSNRDLGAIVFVAVLAGQVQVF